ncbi:3-methyl-2-oxobutanoate hydroxymethyltransferase [bacterium]|nr:3-methyl-2-oxobutanoate hydroxymethyltransferase [bacterium]
MSTPPRGKSRLTVPQFVARKAEGKKLTVLTAYDYPMASLVDQAGIDAILVGDTLSMVVQGHDSTIPVTLDEMIYHAEMVTRAVQNALVIVDMPFPSNLLGVLEAIRNAGRILKETGAQAVKLEGGADQAEVIAGLVNAGIPVMAHIGLRPQLVHQMGGYKVQRDRERLIKDAQAAAEAGAFSIVLECIPRDDAAEITKMLDIPTIGIGAGPSCDGQVLVLNDMLGLTEGHVPKFVKQYANIRETITTAVKKYCNDVQSGEFPAAAHTFR